jgi:hypothetical protein
MPRVLGEIDKLGKIIERQGEEREREKLARLFFTERERMVASLPASISTEFWCEACQLDFIRQAIKITQTWTGQLTAFYETRCACGAYCRRQITDKPSDPYYQQSRLLQASKRKMEIDLLQPHDPRFRIYWGDPYEGYWDAKEAEERREREKSRLNGR